MAKLTAAFRNSAKTHKNGGIFQWRKAPGRI